MMSKPLSRKYRMSAICFSLLSSAERISTVASGWNIISRMISSFILLRQSSALHCETPMR